MQGISASAWGDPTKRGVHGMKDLGATDPRLGAPSWVLAPGKVEFLNS